MHYAIKYYGARFVNLLGLSGYALMMTPGMRSFIIPTRVGDALARYDRNDIVDLKIQSIDLRI